MNEALKGLFCVMEEGVNTFTEVRVAPKSTLIF